MSTYPIIDSYFVSYWNNGIRIETPCKVNILTKEVFDILMVDVPEVDDAFCLEEDIIINNEEIPCYSSDDMNVGPDDYWFD